MKKQGFKSCLLWIGILVIVLSLSSLVFKFGYCHGWWGKENLILRSLWLCSCPPEFEQSLYPEHVEILVSACECEDGTRFTKPDIIAQLPYGMYAKTCKIPGAIGVPGGQFMTAGNNFIDLYSGQRILLNLHPHTKQNSWLTDDLAWIRIEGEFFLFQRLTHQIYHVHNIFRNEEDITLDELLEKLREAEQVYVTDPLGSSGVIFLAPNVWDDPDERIFHFSKNQNLVIKTQGLENFLANNQIEYQRGTSSTARLAGLSPSSRFRAERDGIYDTQTEERLFEYGLPTLSSRVFPSTTSMVPARIFPYYWRSDEKAIVFITSNSIHFGGSPPVYCVLGFHGVGIYFDLPQPILLVHLPEEVVDAVPMPAP